MKELDLELVERTIGELFWEETIKPFLISPIENLYDYFDRNSFLFTLLGVFGAISLYANEVVKDGEEVGSLIGDIAVVTGFSLVIILSCLAVFDAFRRIEYPLLNFCNWGIYLFLSFFIPLTFVIIGLVSQFPTIWAAYSYIVVWFISVGLSMSVVLVVIWTGSRIDQYKDTDVRYTGIMALIFTIFSFYVFHISEDFTFADTTIEGGVSLVQLQKSMWTYSTAWSALLSMMVIAVIISSVIFKYLAKTGWYLHSSITEYMS